MSVAFIFPGQGSQKIGMATAFMHGYKVGMETMAEIEDAISFKVSHLIENGTMDELTRTSNAQPAIFAVSMMVVKILEKEYGYNFKRNAKYLAGHSLGEYSALCTAGVFSLEDAARLVRIRGKLMEEAYPNKEESSMVALIGVCADDIEDMIKQYNKGKQICTIANDNTDNQVVVSGSRKAVEKFIENAKEKTKLTKAIPLNTSGPFHSPLMAKVAIEFDKQISAGYEPHDFQVPVIMNVTAEPLNNKNEVKEYMVQQIPSRLRWRQTLQKLTLDPEISEIIEVAPGKVLTNMLKRYKPDARATALETVSQIEEFIKSTEEEK